MTNEGQETLLEQADGLVSDLIDAARIRDPEAQAIAAAELLGFIAALLAQPEGEREPDGWIVEGHIGDGLWIPVIVMGMKEDAERWLEKWPKWQEAGAQIRPFVFIPEARP